MSYKRSNCNANQAARPPKQGERGVALFFAIFALLLLSAIAAALILSSSTDTAINLNYRSEAVAYYGAKSGIEEVRDRLMTTDPNGPIPTALLPTTAASPQVYVLNEGSQAGTVKPWLSTNTYVDDEFCHDGYTFAGMSAGAADQPCTGSTGLPTGSAWYTTTTSNTPWSGTSAALPYKWVRLGLKLDGSVSSYTTDQNSGNAADLVCWNGVSEEVLPTAQAQTVASCTTAFASPANPVYLITALGVAPNGARKMLQAEVALTPTSPFPYGLFATSSACPAISFSGNNASTNSYTTAAGGTYASTVSTWGGDIGSNGGVSVGNGNVAGLVGVLASACGGAPFSIGSNGSDLGPSCSPASASCVACSGPTGPLCLVKSPTPLPAPYTFAVPPAPNPPTPNTAYNGSMSIVAGTYGNISITGNKTLTLAPGVYNINSISMAGNGQIKVSPPGAVTLNIGGVGQANPLGIAGNGITDDTKANDFVINYAGSGAVSIAGNGNITAILNAPNAAVTQVGNGNWYGSILASTMNLTGNAFFHFDRNAALSPNNNGYYSLLSYRELPY